MHMKTILVTGGNGYIGSHVSLELLREGYEVVVIDNLSNSYIEAIKRVEKLSKKNVYFYNIDLRDKLSIKKIFNRHQIDSVIHLAGLKSLSDSFNSPLNYYSNNLSSTINLCEAMVEADCKSIVFSSSATVYGNPKSLPIKENFPLCAENPYGRSKLTIETLLSDLCNSDPKWKVAILRYFNPVGSDESGLIGESPIGTINNLFPFISQVAIGNLKKLKIFGGDYNTHDGTGVRDFIHVVDLAKGHIKALEAFSNYTEIIKVNLGTGRGYSVLEVVKKFEEISKIKIPFEVVHRRDGDISECYADASLAKKIINWKYERDLTKMCEDSWNWQKLNPKGY